MPKTQHKQSKKSDGFTIIEILFVLAIAGVILMLVFQAIPTLQRNARNSTRKQDNTAILSAVSTYMLNNSGNMPPACDGSSTPCTVVFLQHTPLRFYHPGNVDVNLCSAQHRPEPDDDPGCDRQVHTTMPGVPDPAPAGAANWMKVYNYYRCAFDLTTGEVIVTAEAAGYFDVVAMYYTEGSAGATNFECQQM